MEVIFQCPLPGMKNILIVIGLFSGMGVSAQDRSIEKISLVLRDSERYNRKVPVDMFFPSDAGDKESTLNRKKLPLICFGHGYLISGEWYSHVYELLVPEGYIVIFPASEDGMFPSHKKLAEDMVFAINEIEKFGLDSSSPLYGRVDTIRCLMGHSMGGGSMILAATMTSDIDAIIALSPFDTRPSAIKAASSVKVPALIFSGSNDCITPSGRHHLPIYNSLSGSDKTYILIKGGTHCQMGVSHPKCDVGEKLAGCREGISQDEQLKILSRYIIPWLRFFLYGDVCSGEEFDSGIEKDNAVEYLRSRPLYRSDLLDKSKASK